MNFKNFMQMHPFGTNFLTGIMLLFAFSAFSQISIKGINKDDTASSTLKPDTIKKDFKKNISDVFIGGGFVFGPSDQGDAVKYGNSREFITGVGYVRKFVKWNGLGIDAYYKSTGYFLEQNSDKILPNTIQHNSEKISFDNFGGLVFDRFYIHKLFIDGGFYYDWAFLTKHVTWDYYSTANMAGGSYSHSIDGQLTFLTSSNYGLTFRFGYVSGVSLYFNYRLTNVFVKGTAQNPDLYYNLPFPPFIIGLVIGGH